MVKARGSRQAATSQAGSVVRIQSGRGTDAVAVEATPGQQVGSLAALGQVERTGGTETPPDEIAGDPGPVALETLQDRGDGLAPEAMGAQSRGAKATIGAASENRATSKQV